MALTLSAIIAEADIRVPNSFSAATKVDYLNEVNQEFFSVVKIPVTYLFSGVAGTADYVASTNMRAKNIDQVVCGSTKYMSYQFDDVDPGRAFWSFNDTTTTLTLTPPPAAAGQGVARYFMMPTTTFVTGTLTVNPDAPQEYHHLYVLGLCAKVAKAIPDVSLGNNYQQEYETQLQIAMQNYIRKGK